MSNSAPSRRLSLTEAWGTGPVRDVGAAILVAIALVATYWPALHGRFLWNDGDYVTAPALRSFHGLGRIWFEVNATEQYYPLLHTAFWIEHRLWGDSAFGYHLATLAFHAASAFLVFRIGRRLNLPGAGLAGALFALHPVCVESVAWISEQKNTLSTVFCLGATCVYLAWDGPENSGIRRPGLYLIATFLFVAAILSKSVTATLPAILLILTWWRRGSLEVKRDLLPLFPWFVLGAIDGLFTGWVEWKYLGAGGPSFTLSAAQRVQVAGHVIWFYLSKLAWPVHLMFFYPRWSLISSPAASYLFPLAALGVALYLAWRAFRGALTAYLIFVCALFPVLGFLNVYAFVFSFVADHWQYLASVSILTAAAAGLTVWGQRLLFGQAALRGGLAALLLSCLAFLSHRQAAMYANDQLLYETTLRSNPNSAMAQHNLGNVLEAGGKPKEALFHYKEAVRIEPDYPDAYNDWGVALVDMGKTQEAVARYHEALALRPDFPQALSNLGSALLALGKDAEAREALAAALRLNPIFPQALNNLGMVCADNASLPEAIGYYRRALSLAPNFADAHNNLGVALSSVGQRQEAAAEYNRALELNPRFTEAYSNLGNVLLALGKADKAIAEYQAALKLNPGYVQARFNLGVALASMGRVSEAISQFHHVLQIDSGFAPAMQQLSRLETRTSP